MNLYQTILEQAIINVKDSLKGHTINGREINDSMAFLIYSVMTILGVDIYEAIESITEGGGDNNIDAFCIDQTSENIIISIFQSKYRKNTNKSIAKNDIDLLVKSLENIFSGENNIYGNDKLLNKVKDLKSIIRENGISKKPIVNIYFVTNGLKPNKGDTQSIDDFRLNKNNFEFKYFDTNDLLEIDTDQNKKDYKVRFFSKGKIVEHSLGKVKSLILMLPAESLIKLYEEGGKDKILDKNIRYFLGNNKINQKIKETAESDQDSSYFYCFNNGISLVCDYIEYEDDANGNKIIDIENPNIVNGGQTTKTLYKLYKDNKLFGNTLSNITVLARIYETKNQELINKIVEGTNRQNPIYVRDIKANDNIQKMVKKYFEQKGYYLEVKRNEFKGKNINKSKIISNDRLLQAYISFYDDIPTQAYLSKSKVFERYFSDIFSQDNENLSKKMFRSFEILNFVEKKGDYIESSLFSILYIISKLNDDYKNFNIDLDKEILTNDYNKAKNIISNIITKKQEKLGEKYSNNNLFKSTDLLDMIERELH